MKQSKQTIIFFLLVVVLAAGNQLKAQIIPDLVYVEGGKFMMGNPSGFECERPAHEVRLSSFSIGKYLITFDQYDAYCDSVGIRKPSDKDFGRGNRPVICVSSKDAEAYCSWLSRKTGKNYRLPTEAEWEYASRGGNKSRGYVYSGSNDVDSVGWCLENAGRMTHPVGQKQPNELGIYDMSGNVWEWCSDWYARSYRSAGHDNPQGPTTGTFRVLRGGCWADDGHGSSSTDRVFNTINETNGCIGFRVVLVP